MPPDDAFAPNGAAPMAPIDVSSVQAPDLEETPTTEDLAQPGASPPADEPNAAMVLAGESPAPPHILRVSVPATRPYPFTMPALAPRRDRAAAAPPADEDAFAGLTALGP